jgi:hypothetical protein
MGGRAPVSAMACPALDGRSRGWGVAPVSDAIHQFLLQGGNPHGFHLRRAILF